VNQPLVSVIITTFQRKRELINAIDSVVAQTYPNLEIIIVDDNGIGKANQKWIEHKVKNEYLNHKLIYLKHEVNKGLPSARNTGINIAMGEFISFLDDDDEWLPTKIEKQIKLFYQLPLNYGIVSCGWNFIDLVNQKNKIKFPQVKGNVNKFLGLNYFSPPSMIMIRANLLKAIGGFDENFLWRQDIELYYRLSFICEFEYVEEVLVNYYFHKNSMSTNFNRKLFFIEKFIEKHKLSLQNNKTPWSEIHERKGDLEISIGKNIEGFKSYWIAISNRPLRVILILKMLIGIFKIR
jgi:glycosyltransferase involved in cell wall biosynthesis